MPAFLFRKRVGKGHTEEFAYPYAIKKVEDYPEEYCVIFAHFKEKKTMSDIEAKEKAEEGLEMYKEKICALKKMSIEPQNLEDIALVYTMKILIGNKPEYAEAFSLCFGFPSIQSKSTEYKSRYAEGYAHAKKTRKESYSRAYARAYAEYIGQKPEKDACESSELYAQDWTLNRKALFKIDSGKSVKRGKSSACDFCGLKI